MANSQTGAGHQFMERTRSGENASSVPLHPAWVAFVKMCCDLQYGEIESVRIQDGLPVMAEVVKKKIKFV